jgi:hypothetical protein
MEGRRGGAVSWLLAGALIGPPVLMSVYLGLSRWPTRWFTTGSDWAALALSAAVGAVCIAWLPVSAAVRITLAAVYLPVEGYALFLYTLYFVGVVFGDWL